ncbi:molecular chaperone [Mycobacterium holsaticum DSM 44478]|uniref:Hsp70 family protein n=1 Tax=Mycolicibacterium holsaticum TaxID=152142 RepID=UPI0022EC3E80|nr:Hsp70 family protein [Mycolicibacterium holsaticum]MDA4108082.1 molecular chaperone [Mycolicibacterium holsaticum DSM 44478 = JCM 12374]
MSDGVGLSVGATNLAAVVVGRTAVSRSPVLTRYPHRPPEVGVPSENPRLNERGLILTDFVDRVGDPVGIVAADGTTHRADVVLADALRAMLYAVGGGRVPAGPITVTHPAHWRPAAVDALREALAAVPEFRQPKQVPVVSDATAALTALQDDPGVPARGVIALCDFGGSGTSITLVDAANGYTPVGPTVRHSDLSGDLIDQALLTHVIEDLSAAGSIDLSGTSAIGSLARLRAQCRGAKERLSTAAATTLIADLPGHRTEARVTRNELDEAIRQPVAEFTAVLQDTLERNGIHNADILAVASVGGGARIPILTTALSEHFRVPVITAAHPELTAAIGGGLAAVRGTVEEGATSMSAAAATAMAPEAAPPPPGTPGALAWSDAEDIPEVSAADPYDYPVVNGRASEPRPQVQFEHESWDDLPPPPLPWYRKPAVAAGVGVLAVLAALTAAALFVISDDAAPSPASTTDPITATPRPATTAPPTSEPAQVTQAPPPPPRTVTQQAPPPVTQTVTAPPPPEPPPTTPEPPPPTTPEPPPWSPTPPYPTIPGLPWVPAPQLPQPPGP